MKKIPLLVVIPWLAAASLAYSQSAVDEVIDAGEPRLQQNQRAQEQVDKLHDDTLDLMEQYQSLLKVVDGLKVYNRILAKQLNDQTTEIRKLEGSISEAAVIERQILPLLVRMLDGLEDFIQLDLPFLLQERNQRVANLRGLIESSTLSNAEKARRVFEAFQIENDYGYTIETYKGKLNIGESTFDVDFLRIGRVSLSYRTVGAEQYGYWDPRGEAWKPLTSSRYRRNIDKGIKMARQELAPELVTIPVVVDEETQ